MGIARSPLGDAMRTVAPSTPRAGPRSVELTAQQRGELGATPIAELYRDDGIDYLTLRPGEVLVDVTIPSSSGWRSAFWKIRRRLSIDFALVSAAVAVRMDGDQVAEARIGLGSVGSCPLFPDDVAATLLGTTLDDEAIAAAAEAARRLSRPMETSDMPSSWRRRVLPVAVRHALREVRGDDVSAERARYAPPSLRG